MKISNKEVKIGEKKVVYSTGIIIPNNEVAHIEFIYDNNRISMGIRLKQENKTEKSTSTIEVEVVDDQLVWTFINWDNSLGTATTEPIAIATLKDDRTVSLMVACWAVGHISKMDFQFLI